MPVAKRHKKKKNIFHGMYRAVRYRYLQLFRIKATSHSIALGLGIGVGVGCLPCMGIQSSFALPIAWLAGGNVAASLIGVWWTNPITAIPVYYTAYSIGAFFMHSSLSFSDFSARIAKISNMTELMGLGYDILVPMTIGSVVMGIILGPVCYVLTKNALEKRKLLKLKKKLKLQQRLRELEQQQSR